MRDYYDIHELLQAYHENIDPYILKNAFQATCAKRNTSSLLETGPQILSNLSSDSHLSQLWTSYQKKYSYASDISYQSVIQSTTVLFCMINS